MLWPGLCGLGWPPVPISGQPPLLSSIAFQQTVAAARATSIMEQLLTTRSAITISKHLVGINTALEAIMQQQQAQLFECPARLNLCYASCCLL